MGLSLQERDSTRRMQADDFRFERLHWREVSIRLAVHLIEVPCCAMRVAVYACVILLLGRWLFGHPGQVSALTSSNHSSNRLINELSVSTSRLLNLTICQSGMRDGLFGLFDGFYLSPRRVALTLKPRWLCL